MHYCDKCGREVMPWDDAFRVLAIERGENPEFVTLHRHIMPFIDENKKKCLCVGSPSTRQYLEGQPRDVRPIPAAAYRTEQEARVRRAYQKLQELYPKPV